MVSTPCPACGKAPSGLISKPHDFCEHCGAAFPRQVELVTRACYRCGAQFQSEKGERPFCPACVALVGDAPEPRQGEQPFDDEPPGVPASAGGTVLIGQSRLKRALGSMLFGFLYGPALWVSSRVVGVPSGGDWARGGAQLVGIFLGAGVLAALPCWLLRLPLMGPADEFGLSPSERRRRRYSPENLAGLAAFLLGLGLMRLLMG